MVNVSWDDAKAYCQWAGYRLPTEAEWEYAAREGGRKVRFGNGRDVADPGEINFDGSQQYKMSYSRSGINRNKTAAVGSFAANALGLHDMSGNVWEWCSDWYAAGYYGSSPRTDPRGPASGTGRILRGGSWSVSPDNCRVTYRFRLSRDYRSDNIGFRVVRSAQ